MAWQDRLIVERDELADKLFKLKSFLENSENLKNISNNDIALLITQKYAMTQYLDILKTRISCLEPWKASAE